MLEEEQPVWLASWRNMDHQSVELSVLLDNAMKPAVVKPIVLNRTDVSIITVAIFLNIFISKYHSMLLVFNTCETIF
jgi:hypothetical protein